MGRRVPGGHAADGAALPSRRLAEPPGPSAPSNPRLQVRTAARAVEKEPPAPRALRQSQQSPHRPRWAGHQAPGYHGLQDSLRSLHLHRRTKGSEFSYIGPLAGFSSIESDSTAHHLDWLSTKQQCGHCPPSQQPSWQLGPPSYSLSPNLHTSQEHFL